MRIADHVRETVTRPGDSPLDTTKRLLGGTALFLLTSPVPGRFGFTIPHAMRLADAIGAHARDPEPFATPPSAPYANEAMVLDDYPPEHH